MLKLICKEMAATIHRETGAVVEVTITTADTFSVYTEDGGRFDSVVALLSQVATLTERLVFEEKGEPTEYYAYFQTAPAEAAQNAARDAAGRQWSAGMAERMA